MNHLKFILIGLVVTCGTISLANGKIINCYYGSWAHYRPGDGAFRAEHIDPYLCTHISFSFYGINSVTGDVISLDPDLHHRQGQVRNVMKLKEKNPKLKVLLVVGGWNECATDKYSRMAASPAMRRNFITSAEQLIREHGFDGMDLDWEYPVVRAGTPADKQNFVTLLSETYKAMKAMGKVFGIAVAGGEAKSRQAYDIPGIVPHVDFINVMTYDFASFYDRIVGFNAPLAGQGQNNVKSSISFWMRQGAPASKLVLGLAFYGRTFRLANSGQYSPGSPVVGGLNPGQFTGESGFLGYNEICRMKPSYSEKWSSESSVPFLHKGTEFISYDNAKSLELKIDYGNSLNLAGVMIWSIETDDLHNRCGGGVFPLLNAVNRRVLSTEEQDVGQPDEPANTHAPPAEPTNEPETTHSPPAKPNEPTDEPTSAGCTDGLYPHPTDCSLFINCFGNVEHVQRCPAGLHFDVANNYCNFPEEANCSTAP